MKRFEIVVGDRDDVMFRTDDRQDAIQWFVIWACRYPGYVALRTDGSIERARIHAPSIDPLDIEELETPNEP